MCVHSFSHAFGKNISTLLDPLVPSGKALSINSNWTLIILGWNSVFLVGLIEFVLRTPRVQTREATDSMDGFALSLTHCPSLTPLPSPHAFRSYSNWLCNYDTSNIFTIIYYHFWMDVLWYRGLAKRKISRMCPGFETKQRLRFLQSRPRARGLSRHLSTPRPRNAVPCTQTWHSVLFFVVVKKHIAKVGCVCFKALF